MSDQATIDHRSIATTAPPLHWGKLAWDDQVTHPLQPVNQSFLAAPLSPPELELKMGTDERERVREGGSVWVWVGAKMKQQPRLEKQEEDP